MRTYTHIFKGGDICVHVLSSCGTPAVLRVCPGLLDWRAHCGKASPLECQSPSPSTSRTSPSPLWRQRICSTSRWTPPPEWVERKRSLQKQNLLSKALLDQAPSKANGPAWTSKLSCWVSSGEQTAGTLHHSRGRLCRPDQKKGLNTRSSKRGRGSGPGSAHPPPHSLCDAVKLSGLPSFCDVDMIIGISLHSRAIPRLKSEGTYGSSLGEMSYLWVQSSRHRKTQPPKSYPASLTPEKEKASEIRTWPSQGQIRVPENQQMVTKCPLYKRHNAKWGKSGE